MTAIGRHEGRGTDLSRDSQAHATSAAGSSMERAATMTLLSHIHIGMPYRLIRSPASAFPLYVDAHAPGPFPPTLSPLIDGRGGTR